MNLDQLMRNTVDSTAQHFLYFGLGFSSAIIVFLMLGIGFMIGNWRKRKNDKS